MNSTEDTNAARRGSGSNDQLGQAPERAAFARWCRENGHGELDDMLTPLDRSLRALMWPVWQGAMAAERERCAALCESAPFTGNTFPVTQMEQLRRDIAAAILGPNVALSR